MSHLPEDSCRTLTRTSGPIKRSDAGRSAESFGQLLAEHPAQQLAGLVEGQVRRGSRSARASASTAGRPGRSHATRPRRPRRPRRAPRRRRPSPQSGSGIPTTAAAATEGCSTSTVSISPGERFSPAADDDVVEPAVHEEEAALVEVSLVAGIEPAVVRARPGALVLPGHLLAPDPDLAPFARAQHGPVHAPYLHLDASAAVGRPTPAGPGRRGPRWRGPRGGRRDRAGRRCSPSPSARRR